MGMLFVFPSVVWLDQHVWGFQQCALGQLRLLCQQDGCILYVQNKVACCLV